MGPLLDFAAFMRCTLLVPPLLALAACATTIESVELPVESPEAFSEPGQVALPAQWWRSLGDVELDRLINLALAGNLDLRAAWARLDQTSAARSRSGRRPQLSAA